MKPGKRSRYEAFVWGADAADGPAWRRATIWTLRLGEALFNEAALGRLTLWAMSLVYTTLLSLVPLLAVSFSVLKGFGVHNQILPLLQTLLTPLGEAGVEISHRIVGFVEKVDVGVLGAMGLVVLVVTVVTLIEKIEKAFNEVWQVRRIRPFVQRVSGYLSVILVGPLLVFSAIGVTAGLWSESIGSRIMALETVGGAYHALVATLPYLLVTLAFMFIYILIPNTRVRPGPAFVGAVLAGVLWEGAGWAFGAFAAGSSSYTAIYSTFAILILFMIWLYLSWLILLLGARIAFFIQHPAALIGHRLGGLPPWHRLRLGLELMTAIGRRHLEGRPPADADRLAKALAVPPAWIESVVTPLVSQGFLLPGRGDPPVYLPARDLETISMTDLVSALIGMDDGAGTERTAVDGALAAIRAGIVAGLDGMDLRTWLRDESRHEPPPGQGGTDAP